MKRRIAIVTSLFASMLLVTAHAAPPDGKGNSQNAGNGPGKSQGSQGNKGGVDNPGKGGPTQKGNDYKSLSTHGNNGKAGGGKGDKVLRAGGGVGQGNARRYDDSGRYYQYFDGNHDRRGHSRGGDALGDLVFAGITAALAREYVLDYGLGGYSSLPPGIRKNLYRGKPLPPGIAKKITSPHLLGRLPRHPGYEWRIAGSDLILIAVGSMIVADILYDVFD